ncbi:hypothetical protein ACOMHN_018175 [Nucella lapillus]
MLTISLFSAVLAVTSALSLSFPPLNLNTTCLATLCQVGYICQEDTRNGITQARCVLPDAKPSCAHVVCDPGQVCELQQVHCFRAPCYPVPTCVKGKAGQCPVPRPGQLGICASTCSSDAKCPGIEKCCRNPCGATTCQRPQGLIPIKPSCATAKCGAGQKCVMRTVQCLVAPCPESYPECVPADKPGACPKPRYSPFSYFNCRRQCHTDVQCPGARKCCRSGCRSLCQDPVVVTLPQFPTCALVDCKPDHRCVMRKTCDRRGCFPRPVCEPVKRCPFYPAVVNCPQRHFCSVDDPNACHPGTTCCSTNCGRRCVRPLE